MLGDPPRNQGEARILAGWLAKSGENAARDWRIAGLGAGMVAVPVMYRLDQDRANRWRRVTAADIDMSPWMLVENQGELRQLGENGRPASTRVRLVDRTTSGS